MDLGSKRKTCDQPSVWRVEALSLGVNSGVATWGRIDWEERYLYLAKKVVGVVEELNLVFFGGGAVFVPEEE